MSQQSQRDWKRRMFKRERVEERERNHNTRTGRDGKECPVLKKKYVEVQEVSKGGFEILFKGDGREGERTFFQSWETPQGAETAKCWLGDHPQGSVPSFEKRWHNTSLQVL